MIRLKTFPKYLKHPMLVKIKRIKPPYKFEIEMLKQQQFDPSLKDKILMQ